MPVFFWIFLIMAFVWYTFVFRVLCCDSFCREIENTCKQNDIEQGEDSQETFKIQIPPYDYIIVSK